MQTHATARGYPSKDRHAAALLRQLMAGPGLYFHSANPAENVAVMARMTEQNYIDTTFMDERLSAAEPKPQLLPLNILLRMFNDPEHALPRPENLHFLMHTSHCGSTLVSRMLQALGAQSLREPVPLKDLCRVGRARAASLSSPLPEPFYTHLLSAFESLAARTWRDGQIAVVKPSSYAVSMTEEFLRRLPTARAVLLDVTLDRFLANIVRRDSTLQEAHSALLKWHTPDPIVLFGESFAIDALSPGKKAGLLYACNKGWMLRAMQSEALAGRLHAVDFDEFLGNPKENTVGLMRFLTGDPNFTATDAQHEALDALLGRSAKDAGQTFDAATRLAELERAAEQHTGEIGRGRRLASRLLAKLGSVDGTAAPRQV